MQRVSCATCDTKEICGLLSVQIYIHSKATSCTFQLQHTANLLIPFCNHEERLNACRLIASHCNSHFNPTADCGTPPPPVNGSVQPHTNTTEGSVVVFQCDIGFVPEGMMTAVCGSDGQWTPNQGGITCSPRPTQNFTQASTEAPTQASMPTQTPTPTGKNGFLILL